MDSNLNLLIEKRQDLESANNVIIRTVSGFFTQSFRRWNFPMNKKFYQRNLHFRCQICNQHSKYIENNLRAFSFMFFSLKILLCSVRKSSFFHSDSQPIFETKNGRCTLDTSSSAKTDISGLKAICLPWRYNFKLFSLLLPPTTCNVLSMLS